MELEREARKSRFARPNQLPDTEPVAPKLLREKAPDALEDMAPHIVPASPMMFGPNITGSLFCDTNEAGNGLVFRGEGAHIYSVGSETYSYATYKPSNNVHIRAKIDFSAGASSSVYGGSSTVQPSAMASLVLIKF